MRRPFDRTCTRISRLPSCLPYWLLVAFAFGSVGCTVTVGQSALFPPRLGTLPSMPEAVQRRNVELLVSDGVTLRGWYLEKPGALRTVLFFYGNRSSVVASTWELYWFADALNANVVAFDYRGYGFSDGVANLDRIADDALEIHRFAIEKLGRGRLPLVVVGQSMGTAAALHVAANRNIDALALLAPPGTIDDLIAAMRAQAPWYVGVEADASLKNLRLSPLEDARRVRAKTLFVSGIGDTLARPAAIARLTSACGAPIKYACRVHGGHGDVHAESPEVRKCVADFVNGGTSG